MSKLIISAIQAMKNEWRQHNDNNFLMQDPEAKMEEQIRTLYGRGEINKDRYLQLRFRLHNGLVSESDLNAIHQEAINLKEARGNYILQGSPELEHILNRLYADKVWVEETHDQLEESIQAMRRDIDWIKEQAEDARRSASTAMPDEITARALLQVWQELLSLTQTLDNDLQAMEHELLDLAALDHEIKAAIIKLKLFHSQEQIAGLSQRVRADLLTLS
jgi:hypothetical protein